MSPLLHFKCIIFNKIIAWILQTQLKQPGFPLSSIKMIMMMVMVMFHVLLENISHGFQFHFSFPKNFMLLCLLNLMGPNFVEWYNVW